MVDAGDRCRGTPTRGENRPGRLGAVVLEPVDEVELAAALVAHAARRQRSVQKRLSLRR
jgi:hypothetical protein